MGQTDPCHERSWWECWRDWRPCGSEHSTSHTLRDSAWARWAWRRPARWALGHQRALWRSAPAHQSTPATPVRLAHSAHSACFWFEPMHNPGLDDHFLTFIYFLKEIIRDDDGWFASSRQVLAHYDSVQEQILIFCIYGHGQCEQADSYLVLSFISIMIIIFLHAWDLAESMVLWNIVIVNKNFGWISLKENSWQLKLRTEYL